ncbi:MAG TPA: branched-chain amino acid ABC transporter permease [Pseudonocardiaceae bacterium]|jgi:branched-chain amino acid transport system permease protein|nr:branched-chain amino acid ABC transporter permease [Pseudonocardiaceae bacterium]
MVQFIDLTLGGLSAGAVYAAVALALVLIWRATRIVNFAQGGMLMITTFLAYAVVGDGGSYWLALLVAVVSGLVLGAVVERLVIRPVENKPPLNAVVVTFGLLVLLQGAAGMVFGGTPKSYPPAFGIRGFVVSGRRLLFTPNDLWVVLVVLAVMAGLAAVFRWTPLGLRMRSAAFAPEVARLLGVRVGRMFTVGWALAAAVGALAGVLIAPTTFVSPNTFDSTLVYGFTGAVIGGLDSPPGAVVGGVSLGIVLSWVSGYLGSDVVGLGALVVLVVVLMVRPNGLFGHAAGRRV